MLSILDYDREKLQEVLRDDLGLEPFRANQIFRWIYKERVKTFELMTDITKSVRQKLAKSFSIFYPRVKLVNLSKDGTKKYMFELEDGECIESVLIKQPKRWTVCISTQVGCAMGCKFCKTATLGLKRNLEVHEIIGQVLAIKDDTQVDFYNIVFMGMGEPLHNLKNVLVALKILSDDYGLCFSERKLTVSTSGLVPAIQKFGNAKNRANLAVSLNATTDEVRNELMPINKKYPLKLLIETLRSYPLRGRQCITIEYVLLRGVNDSVADRRRLKKLLHNIPVKINLIPYNTNVELGFERPSREVLVEWQQDLCNSKFNTTIRWSKGNDVNAACGQLIGVSGIG
ncbi:MAG: 23S rRNA (adenine(2503)-C(2))-methyltransferase RlmN [Deltaproteobacteria bacterium]|jgi:23S rRNA (adenine2503-C2)-methyltransferase|nr:23S rRNA (adenine(2503)-C(2))-methyltransferase RlmN [Deltaproteobacteria bacterium]